MKFTVKQIDSLFEESLIHDENGNVLFELVDEQFVSFNQEKGLSYSNYVVKEVSTNKFWKGELRDSEYGRNNEYNSNVIWEEVTPIKIETIIYE